MNRFLPFEEAREYVRSLGLKNYKEWKLWAASESRPKNIPYRPEKTYKEEFVSYPDWLGYADVFRVVYRKREQFLSFEEARGYARSLDLKSKEAWKRWAASENRPRNIPSRPCLVYEGDFVSYSDWLGCRVRTNGCDFLPFEEARNYAQSLGLKSYEEWREWVKSEICPSNIPSDPNYVYPEFAGYADWLGYEPIRRRGRNFLPFEEARNYARSLGLESRRAWHRWATSGNRPLNIPSYPHLTYKEEFAGYDDWLGR